MRPGRAAAAVPDGKLDVPVLLPFGRQGRAELTGHGGEVRLQPADLIPTGRRQGDRVVAVGDGEGGRVAPGQAHLHATSGSPAAYPSSEGPALHPARDAAAGAARDAGCHEHGYRDP